MPGTNLRAIVQQNQLRAVSKQKVQPGGHRLLNLPYRTQETLHTEVGGVKYPIFVLGVDDPDDTDTDRYIP